MNRLICCEVFYDGKKTWSLKHGTKMSLCVGSAEDFAAYLRSAGATDDRKGPRSFKSVSYPEMVRGIQRGEPTILWVRDQDLAKLPLKQINDDPGDTPAWG
jgi:hypothetical protein